VRLLYKKPHSVEGTDAWEGTAGRSGLCKSGTVSEDSAKGVFHKAAVAVAEGGKGVSGGEKIRVQAPSPRPFGYKKGRVAWLGRRDA